MSVRMALAKLCACTCGGALMGGGMVQISQASDHGVTRHQQVRTVRAVPKMRTRVVHRATHPRRVAANRVRARTVQRVRRVVTRRTIYPGQPTVITQTAPGAPYARPMPAPQGEYSGGGGGGGYPIVIGGGGGFGGGNRGGFGGGNGGGGNRGGRFGGGGR